MEISAKKYEGLLYSTPLKSTSPFPSSQDCFDSCQTVFPISLIIEVEISAKKNKRDLSPNYLHKTYPIKPHIMQLIIRINTFGNPRLYIPNVEPNANIIINNCTNINFIIPIYFASYKRVRNNREKTIGLAISNPIAVSNIT